jgi:hypothetical protein
MARINVESDAVSGDPRIVKRLPRFTGLSRFDALGRLVLVWGLGYARKSTTLSEEDIDDAAEHTGFASAMVRAELADVAGDGVVRVRGLEARIGYLLTQSEKASMAGKARQEGAQRVGGRFVPNVGAATYDQRRAGDEPADAGDSPAAHQPAGQQRAGFSPASTSRSSLDLDLLTSGSGSSLDQGSAEGSTPPAPASAPSKPKRLKRAEIPLPDDWTPNDSHTQLAQELQVDVQREARSFRDHAQAHGRRLVDWNAGFRTWLNNAVRFARRGNGVSPHPNAPRPRPPEFGKL